ncbi:MAG: hypothetical protein D6719_04535 [Candidatus Dadabacteria bacterium]|nr:MAG: hypothetical protein D6719_04535 [Candidatus Dadabacteria bacterium]
MSKDWFQGFLLGFFIVLGVGLASSHFTRSYAQGQGNQFLLLSGNMNNHQYDYIYVMNTTTKRMAVYRFYRGYLDLLDVRNIKYDLRLDYYNKYTFNSIKKVKAALKKQ